MLALIVFPAFKPGDPPTVSGDCHPNLEKQSTIVPT
jgi:hypothetical protein